MSEASAKFTRRHKLLLAALATVSLSLGAAGVVSASQNQSAPTGGNPSSEEVDGVNCENGLVDGVAGAECDSGPAANATNDPAEADNGHESEADEPESSDAAEEVDGVNCENGLVDGVAGNNCDGGPAANPQDGADDATEEGTQTAGE